MGLRAAAQKTEAVPDLDPTGPKYSHSAGARLDREVLGFGRVMWLAGVMLSLRWVGGRVRAGRELAGGGGRGWCQAGG